MKYSYYMTQRPPMPGAQPDGIASFEDFGERRFIPEIGREAWAIIDYERELTKQEISDYELTPAVTVLRFTPAEIDLIMKALLLTPRFENDDLIEQAYTLYKRLRAETAR